MGACGGYMVDKGFPYTDVLAYKVLICERNINILGCRMELFVLPACKPGAHWEIIRYSEGFRQTSQLSVLLALDRCIDQPVAFLTAPHLQRHSDTNLPIIA